jgi:predicted dienelactone hydrolase
MKDGPLSAFPPAMVTPTRWFFRCLCAGLAAGAIGACQPSAAPNVPQGASAGATHATQTSAADASSKPGGPMSLPDRDGGLVASAPTPVFSIGPVVLEAPGRVVPLEVRVSAPTTGRELPIILLSHGHGHSNYLSSLNGYAPLANFYAAHGFVVIQPTHLDSATLHLDPSHPGFPVFWRSRVEDMKLILDQLDRIEAAVPELSGRLDRSRVAVVGHSLGAFTAAILLGTRLTETDGGAQVSLAEPRIKAGALLSAPGKGGADLSKVAIEHHLDLGNPSFAEMTTPALVVMGDKDFSPQLTVRGPDWHADPYFFSGGRKSLLTLFGATHGLGGVAGYDAAETTDESPERVAAVQELTWAFLRSALYPQDPAWSAASAALKSTIGRIESR